eukprot:2384893-Amphidinium_carterae.1
MVLVSNKGYCRIGAVLQCAATHNETEFVFTRRGPSSGPAVTSYASSLAPQLRVRNHFLCAHQCHDCADLQALNTAVGSLTRIMGRAVRSLDSIQAQLLKVRTCGWITRHGPHYDDHN